MKAAESQNQTINKFRKTVSKCEELTEVQKEEIIRLRNKSDTALYTSTGVNVILLLLILL